jgi:hypothetical protein
MGDLLSVFDAVRKTVMVRLSKIGIQALITYVFVGLAALGWGAFVFLFNRPEDYPHGFGGYSPLGILVFFVFPPVMLILSVALPADSDDVAR